MKNLAIAFGLIGSLWAAGATIINLADSRYTTNTDFHAFENRQYIRDINHDIDIADKDIRVFEAKIDANVELTTWEKRLYEDAKRRKARYQSELAKFLNPSPGVQN